MLDYLSTTLTSVEGEFLPCGILLCGDFNQLKVNHSAAQFTLPQLINKLTGLGRKPINQICTIKIPYRLHHHLVSLITMSSSCTQQLMLQGKAQVEEPFPSRTLGPVASQSFGVSWGQSTGQWLAKHPTARLNWCCLRISSMLVFTT